VMSEGRLQIGKWQRQLNTDPVRLFTPNRKLMEIAPGRTWVELADVVDHNVRTG
jgi:hypothetical protein